MFLERNLHSEAIIPELVRAMQPEPHCLITLRFTFLHPEIDFPLFNRTRRKVIEGDRQSVLNRQPVRRIIISCVNGVVGLSLRGYDRS